MKEEYLLNGVYFDGISGNTLLEAKGHYAQFVQKSSGEYYEWFTGQKDLVAQAQRQLRASDGLTINWYFADKEALNATRTLFNKNQIYDINLIYKPMP
jgi:hypothetical protein